MRFMVSLITAVGGAGSAEEQHHEEEHEAGALGGARRWA